MRWAGVHEPWNGNVYRVTIVATVEANSADEAQALTGQSLAGLPSGQGHAAAPLTGPGSWAPDTKRVELLNGAEWWYLADGLRWGPFTSAERAEMDASRTYGAAYAWVTP